MADRALARKVLETEAAAILALIPRVDGAFDRAYAQAMIQDHEADLRAFQDEAQTGTDPDVKAFAARQVPILQEHLRLVRQLPQR